MKNIQEFKKRIEDYKDVKHPDFPNSVCIGKGMIGEDDLLSYFELDGMNLYMEGSKDGIWFCGNEVNNHYFLSRSDIELLMEDVMDFTIRPGSKEECDELIGKFVEREDGRIHKVIDWLVINKSNALGTKTKEVVDKFGYCFNLMLEGTSTSSPMYLFKPTKTTTIKLTNDYDVTIGKGSVQVGCQTIPIEKVEEILKISKSL